MRNVRFFAKDQGKTMIYVLEKEGNGEFTCCGETLKELKAGTVDAAQEKHVPAVKRNGDKLEVVIGSVEHPMEEKHYIQMIAVVQGDKVQIAHLSPEDEPKACFRIEEGPVDVYEHCNLHGLWMTSVD